jgi:AcrR family transcriptional regulator
VCGRARAWSRRHSRPWYERATPAAARAPSRLAGGLNPALIYSHYGNGQELRLAALAASRAERLQCYREALSEPVAPDELVRRAAALFREDVEGGHVTALTELIGASLSKPELREALLTRMQPWHELTRDMLERSPLPIPSSAVELAALAMVSGYLGLNLLSRLMPDLERIEALFALVERLARLADVPRG